jgi:hypothetical protein
MTTAMQRLRSAASTGAEAASSAGLAARHAAQKAREHTEAAVVARKEQYLEVTWRFLEVFGLFFFFDVLFFVRVVFWHLFGMNLILLGGRGKSMSWKSLVFFLLLPGNLR